MTTPHTDSTPTVPTGRGSLVLGSGLALVVSIAVRFVVVIAVDEAPRVAAWIVRIGDLVAGASAVFVTLALLIPLVTDDSALTRALRRSIQLGSVVREGSAAAATRATSWARSVPVLAIFSAFYLLAGVVFDRGLPDWRDSVDVGQFRWFLAGLLVTLAALLTLAVAERLQDRPAR